MSLTFVQAAIIIFKHATFLWSSHMPLSSESALTYAEKDYQAANIKLKIEQYLLASTEEYTVEQLAHFIMSTDIGLLFLHLL